MNKLFFTVAILVILSGCARPLSPLQQLSSDIGNVKLACETACSSPGTTTYANLTVPVNGMAYFTNEAFSVRVGAQLFPARCSCGIAPTENLTAGRYSCSFTRNDTLTVRCA